MLRLEDACLFAGGELLLADLSVSINRGDRVGIVGRNGSGKSHLMQLFAGEIGLDGGKRLLAEKINVLLVKQELPDDDKSPIEFMRDNDPDLKEIEDRIPHLADDKLADAYSRLGEIDSTRYEELAPKVLMGLGLKKEELTQPMRHLSGGLRMRISLAMALIRMPDILLLDEPTNHLDLESTQWLIEFLRTYPKSSAFVIVTHDIKLIMEVTNSTMHLRAGFLTQFGGNYEQYKQELKTREEKDEQKNKELERKIERKKEIYYKFRALPAKRAAQAKDQLRKANLLEAEKVDIITEEPAVQFDFGTPSAVVTPAVKLEDVSIGYDGHAVLKNLNLSIPYGAKIGLLGCNGEGKSTLIKLLANKLKPLSGHADFQLRLKSGYFSQNLTDELEESLAVYEQFKKATGLSIEHEIRARLGQFGFGRDKITTEVKHLSGGEKSRLLLAILCANSPNFLILDEPTNHLDVETRETFVNAIVNFPGSVVLVSHDWDFHEKTMQQFWLAQNGSVTVYGKGLGHYQQELLRMIKQNLLGIALIPGEKRDAESKPSQAGLMSAQNKSNGVKKPVKGEEVVQGKKQRNGKK